MMFPMELPFASHLVSLSANGDGTCCMWCVCPHIVLVTIKCNCPSIETYTPTVPEYETLIPAFTNCSRTVWANTVFFLASYVAH